MDYENIVETAKIFMRDNSLWLSSNSLIMTQNGLTSVYELRNETAISVVMISVPTDEELPVRADLIEGIVRVESTSDGYQDIEDWKMLLVDGVVCRDIDFMTVSQKTNSEFILPLLLEPRSKNILKCEIIKEVIDGRPFTEVNLNSSHGRLTRISVYNHRQLRRLSFEFPKIFKRFCYPETKATYVAVPIFSRKSESRAILHVIKIFGKIDGITFPQIPPSLSSLVGDTVMKMTCMLEAEETQGLCKVE